MAEKKFGIEVFGYSRKAVNKYILEFDKKARNKLEEKEEENSEILNRITVLEKENTAFKEQKEAVSRAVIKAEETAERIIEEANKKAEEIIKKAEEEANRRSLEIEENTRMEITALTKEIENKRANAEREIKELKNELKAKYEKEFGKIIKLRSELNLLKAAASVIVNGNEDKESERIQNRALNKIHKPLEPVSLEEIRELF